MRIHLQLLLVSGLLICKKNVIKCSSRQGMIDESHIIMFSWPSSVLCKRYVHCWKRLISSIGRGDGSLLSPVMWVNSDQRHRRSTAFIPEDKRHIQIVCGSQSRVCKQTRMCNKHLLPDDVVNIFLQDRVEVEAQRNRCKVFDLILPPQVCSSLSCDEVIHNEPHLKTWLVDMNVALRLLESNTCSAIVDGSFFSEYP